MAVKIRLKRGGRKKQPRYRIVAIDSRKQRDGKTIELLGFYSPQLSPKFEALKIERINYWISVGAQPTDVVIRILAQEGIVKKKVIKSSNLGLTKKKVKEQAEQKEADAKEAASKKSDEKEQEKAKAKEKQQEQSEEKAKTESVVEEKSEEVKEAPKEEAKKEAKEVKEVVEAVAVDASDSAPAESKNTKE